MRSLSFALSLLTATISTKAQDGVFDAGFGTIGYGGYDPVAVFPDNAVDIAVDPMGRVVLGGYVYGANNTVCWVCRLLADGSSDPGFGTNGCTEVNLCTSNDQLADIAIQPDGRIVGFGHEDFGIAPFTYDQGVSFRLNVDGTPDSTWNHTGQSFFTVNNADLRSEAVTIAPDGTVLALGWWGSGAFQYNAIWRFAANGLRDSTFNATGLLVLPHNRSIHHSLAVRADGRILVGGRENHVINGTTTGMIAIRRLLPDGSPDSTFGVNGLVLDTLAGGSMDPAMIMLPDERILIYGRWSNGSVAGKGMVQYTADGQRDPLFGSNGAVLYMGVDANVGRACLLADGRVATPVYNNGLNAANILADLPNGTLDAGFGTAGMASHPPPLGFTTTGGLASAAQGDSAVVVLIHRSDATVQAVRYLLSPLSTSSPETTRQNSTALFPVPNGGADVRIRSTACALAPNSVRVRDLSGREVGLRAVQEGADVLLLGSSELQAGVYLVEVRTSCGTMVHCMVID